MQRQLIATLAALAAATDSGTPPAGMTIGSVSMPLNHSGSEYLIFLPKKWTPAKASNPVMLFLHGVGGINNALGCRKPGLTTQFPLMDPAYAAKVDHVVLVPVAKQRNWRHHFSSSMALVDMAIDELGGDPLRVTIAGQSMGGHGAYLYASELAPGRFCAVVAMCAYLDELTPITDASSSVSPAVLERLKSTPLWVFHSEEDDSMPPPGRAQDDSKIVVKAFEAAGNRNVKHTRYPLGRKGDNYIPGHAAFEFAFHDDGLWPWLNKQALSPPTYALTSDPKFKAIGGGLALWLLFCRFVYPRLSLLAFFVSSLALVAGSVAFLGLQQAEGGLLDSCLSYSFVNVDFDKCRSIYASLSDAGIAEGGFLMLAVSKSRAENAFAFGMGLGCLYALLFLRKGTGEVAVVHLMHAGWALSVCAVNAQNAGLLMPFAPPEKHILPPAQAQLVPFVVITGVQGFLALSALLLSSGGGDAAPSFAGKGAAGPRTRPAARAKEE